MIMLECRRVYFYGRVEGVGFRQTTADIAARLPVSGHVKNLPDGRVELLVQGEAEVTRRLVQLVSERFAGFITDTSQQVVPAMRLTGRLAVIW